MDYLSLDYYCDAAGQADAVASALNCLNSKLYFHCKTWFGAQRNWANMFMQSALLCAVRDCHGNLRDFGSLSFMGAHYRGMPVLPCVQDFALQRQRLQGAAALDAIDARLRAGQAVTVDTFCERLPFFLNFRSFDAPYDPARKHFSHFILIVGMNATEYYYVEDPAVLDRRQYRPHPQNRCVGIIAKQGLLPAFEAYAEVHEISIDSAAVDYYTGEAYLRDFLAAQLQACRHAHATPAGRQLSCGDALPALTALVQEPGAELFGQHALLQRSGAPDLKTFLSWQFYDVLAAKKLQAAALGCWEARLPQAAFSQLSLSHRYSVLAWDKVGRTLNTTTPERGEPGRRALLAALAAASDVEQRLASASAAFLDTQVAHG
ncbi:hypothetical protein [Duganella sp. CF458]|uniref:hypothetical protein n=1 Tax=Duganella sp. CF458 TaxID=1884368 RepID=UPI0011133B4F|nr:hypothetical protein [Duganella sp. CF458]